MPALPLSQLASIQAGYQPPGRLASTDAGTHVLLLASCLAADGQISWPSAAPRMVPTRRTDLYELHAGDVLLLVKGQRFTAGLVESSPPFPVLAGPQFFILRPKAGELDSAFLAWFLNRPGTQNLLMRATQGTAIPFLPREAVENLAIPCSPIPQQRRVLEMQNIAIRLKALSDRWHHLQALLVDHACADLIESHP